MALLPELSNAELEVQIGELAGHLNAAHYHWLVLIAEFDRREAWAGAGARSCAHWLNFRCGLDLGAAREKVRVARALEPLPLISAAMQRGELSYSKARALTRVACAATESTLLSIALHGTASHVEELVRRYRQVQEVAELGREAQQQAHRALTYAYEDDGSLSMRVRLPAEAGAIVLRALEAALQELPPDPCATRNVSAETRGLAGALDAAESRRMRRADALAVVAETFLAQGAVALSGGDRQQIVVHVDADTLRSAVPGHCEIEHGPSLAAETARRLACDCSVVTIVQDMDATPLDVGRKTRSIPPALRRALRSRDQGCRFPGCPHRRYVDGHHIEHWANGGATRLSNLVSLCRFHHRLVHEGRWHIQVLDDGALRFMDPRDAVIECRASPSSGRFATLIDDHAALGLGIDAETSATRWRGERMDYGMAVQVLLEKVARAGVAP